MTRGDKRLRLLASLEFELAANFVEAGECFVQKGIGTCDGEKKVTSERVSEKR
jgi:hypothetical protein